MSIKKEVERCMTGLKSTSDGALTAHFIFPEDFLGFQGHFPAQKILPGICQIQCVVSMIEKYTGKAVLLKEIVSVKFLSPVFPSEEIICVCRGLKDTCEDFVAKASVGRDGKAVSELKLRGSLSQWEIKG